MQHLKPPKEPAGLPAYLFVAAAALVFVVRAPLRALTGGEDFRWNYLATRAWAEGLNPYDAADASGTRGPGFPGQLDLGDIGSAYFPAVFPVSWPFSLADWMAAKTLFLAFVLSLFTLLLCRLVQRYLADVAASTWLLFVGLALLMYPTHTGMALLQHSVPAACFALLVMTFDLRDRREMLVAAALAAAATAFKPQVGAVAFFYGAVLWQARFLLAGAAFYLLLTAVGLAPIMLTAHDAGWVADLAANIRSIHAQQADIYCCVNLAPVLRHVFPNEVADTAGLLPLLTIPAAALIYRTRKTGPDGAGSDAGTRLAAMSLCGLAVMLSLYTRPYNMILVLPVLVLLLLRWWAPPGRARFPTLVIAAMAVFLQPIPPLGVAIRWVGDAYLDWTPALQRVWELVVVPAQSYALVILLALSCGWFLRGTASPLPSASRAPAFSSSGCG